MDIISFQTNDVNKVKSFIEFINNISPYKLDLSFEKRNNYYYIINSFDLSNDFYKFILMRLKGTCLWFADKDRKVHNIYNIKDIKEYFDNNPLEYEGKK